MMHSFAYNNNEFDIDSEFNNDNNGYECESITGGPFSCPHSSTSP